MGPLSVRGGRARCVKSPSGRLRDAPTHLRIELVPDALHTVIWRCRPAAVIHHSDHETWYTSITFPFACEEAGVRLTRASIGDCYDNALCDSFFARLECEILYHQRYSPMPPGLAFFDFIESFYNPHRRHSGLDYLSPMSYERRRKSATWLTNKRPRISGSTGPTLAQVIYTIFTDNHNA